MIAVECLPQIAPNPHSPSGTHSTSSTSPENEQSSTSPENRAFPFQTEQLSFLFGSDPARPSSDKKPREKAPRTVSWSTHVEVFRQSPRVVTWSKQVEVFTIPARDSAPNEDEEHTTDASCEDDTVTHCTGRSDGLTACAALKNQRGTVG
jgi:hypothetical protein